LQHLTSSHTFITLKKINHNSEDKKVAKSLHARGLKSGTFRAADAHATSWLFRGSRQTCFSCRSFIL